MHREMAAALCAVLLSGNLSAGAAQAEETAVPAVQVENSAVSAVLMDVDSGRVLYEKNAHERRLIASITKLMTALVAVESTPDLSATVTVKQEWLDGAEGSSIYLKPGEEITLEALLYGLLLESGNDAAQVIAGYCAGDVETFVGWMNLRAEDLGMVDSHFENPSGLNGKEHYSSAYDMALCAVACMDNEMVAKMVGTKSVTLGTRTFVNHNKLLSMYDGCIGMKTGYTELAGRTLVSCAQRDGMRLIAVTLTDPDDWKDHMALFDYGFSTYRQRPLYEPEQTAAALRVTGSLVRSVEVIPLGGMTWPLREDEEITVHMDLPEQVEAPVQEGGIAGKMEFYLGQVRLGSTYLVYARSVHNDLFSRSSLLSRIMELMRGEEKAALGVFLPMTARSA